MAFDQKLQSVLDELWFRMPADTPDTLKAHRQRVLLRELQIYAKGKLGATDASGGAVIEASRLRQAELPATARLPANYYPAGLRDAPTDAVMVAWQTAKLRCPVIFQQRTDKKSNWATIVKEGVVFPGEVTNGKDRVFAVDFVNALVELGQSPERIIVGDAIRRGKGLKPNWFNEAGGLHARTAFTPQSITGNDWAALKKAQGTFRLLASIALVEVSLALDSINAWDTSVFSLGAFQYTAFPEPQTKKPSAGEPPLSFADENGTGPAALAPLLGYFAHRHAADAARLFKSQGLWFDGQWGNFPKPNLAFAGQLTFAASADGQFAPPDSKLARDWLRTWHTIHRMRNIVASSALFREIMWPYARQRVHDMLRASWVQGAPPGANRLGDVFKSETSVAMLLRWHVFRPAHLISTKRNAPAEIVAAAGLQKKPLNQWKAADEAALIGGFHKAVNRFPMRADATADLRNKLKMVEAFSHPEWGKLGRTRDFSLFTDGIPFP